MIVFRVLLMVLAGSWLATGCASFQRRAPETGSASRGAAAVASPPQRPPEAGSSGGRFYSRRPYGTESQFNPLSELVNDGFDQLRTDHADRRLLRQPYAVEARNVLGSLRDAERAYRLYGWSWALRNEFLPLSMKAGGGGQWVPNYQFHVLGSGMVSARMVEWFEQHSMPHPVLLSAVTMTASHVLNEMTERPQPLSVDAITDLAFFDIAGFALFRSDRVQRFFSERVEFTNWPLQPTFTLPSQTLENVGQQYMLRFRLPGSENWRGQYSFGASTLFGASRKIGGGRWFSLGLGADVVKIPVVDAQSDRRTVELKPNAGIFLDREGSLLFSVLARDGYETIATVNFYPGIFGGRGSPYGFWLSALRGGGARMGLVTPWGIGIGHGPPYSP